MLRRCVAERAVEDLDAAPASASAVVVHVGSGASLGEQQRPGLERHDRPVQQDPSARAPAGRVVAEVGAVAAVHVDRARDDDLPGLDPDRPAAVPARSAVVAVRRARRPARGAHLDRAAGGAAVGVASVAVVVVVVVLDAVSADAAVSAPAPGVFAAVPALAAARALAVVLSDAPETPPCAVDRRTRVQGERAVDGQVQQAGGARVAVVGGHEERAAVEDRDAVVGVGAAQGHAGPVDDEILGACGCCEQQGGEGEGGEGHGAHGGPSGGARGHRRLLSDAV